MAKADLAPELRTLYFPSPKEPVFVDVPAMQYLMVDGSGDPNTSEDFRAAIGALYGTAYTIHFAAKKARLPEVPVMPLEALWWSPDEEDILRGRKEKWNWTAMIRMPDHVTAKLVRESLDQLRKKKNPPGLDRVRLERWREGPAAQILHIGPYAAEKPTIERVHAFIREHGRRIAGKHHEIYLGDPRRAAPEKLKTVVRQPCVG